MTVLFDVVDPRGFKVICTEECWNDHILDEHPIMVGLEKEVEETIRKPQLFIYQDRDYPERHIYYGKSSTGVRYTKVIVEFQNPNSGEVITAFLTDSGKTGEALIWPD